MPGANRGVTLPWVAIVDWPAPAAEAVPTPAAEPEEAAVDAPTAEAAPVPVAVLAGATAARSLRCRNQRQPSWRPLHPWTTVIATVDAPAALMLPQAVNKAGPVLSAANSCVPFIEL